MKRTVIGVLLAAGLIVAGLQLGRVYGQRYASKEPIPGAKHLGEVPADFDVWRLFDGEDEAAGFFRFPQGRADAKWRSRIKDEWLQTKPSLAAVAERKRQTARQLFGVRMSELVHKGGTDVLHLIDAKDKLLEAELALCANRDERVKAIENLWLIFKKIEIDMQDQAEDFRGEGRWFPSIVHARVKLEFDLVKALVE